MIKLFQKRKNRENYFKLDEETLQTIQNTIEDIEGEEWRPVKGWNLYLVSNMGRVKRPLQERQYSDGYPVLLPERLIKPYYTKAGYAQVKLSSFGRPRKTFSVHRLVADAFNLPFNSENDSEVHHLDSNPKNNKLSNLQRCTPAENKKFNNRAEKIGETHKKRLSKLTKSERRERAKRAFDACKRRLVCDGAEYESITDFARKNNLNPTTVSLWVRGVHSMPKKYKDLGLRIKDE